MRNNFLLNAGFKINEEKKVKEALDAVELKSINDLLKLSTLPEYIILDGFKYGVGGGSGSSLERYLSKNAEAFISIYYTGPSPYPKVTEYRMYYKASGLSLVPDKVTPEH